MNILDPKRKGPNLDLKSLVAILDMEEVEDEEASFCNQLFSRHAPVVSVSWAANGDLKISPSCIVLPCSIRKLDCSAVSLWYFYVPLSGFTENYPVQLKAQDAWHVFHLVRCQPKTLGT
jgi:hypothetical protein